MYCFRNNSRSAARGKLRLVENQLKNYRGFGIIERMIGEKKIALVIGKHVSVIYVFIDMNSDVVTDTFTFERRLC